MAAIIRKGTIEREGFIASTLRISKSQEFESWEKDSLDFEDLADGEHEDYWRILLRGRYKAGSEISFYLTATDIKIIR